MQQLMNGEELSRLRDKLAFRYYVGLDLGQASDYTAIAVLREDPSLEGAHHSTYQCAHLERFKLGTPYPTIVGAVNELLARPELDGKTRLVVDATGVGRPVVDLFKESLADPRVLKAVSITGGGKATSGSFGYHVPKVDLVTLLRVLLETHRLEFAADLPDVPRLIQEVEAFKVRITDSANAVFGSWRSGSHDDLVLAVALAAWFAERHGQPMVARLYGG